MRQDASGQAYVPSGVAIIGVSGRFPGAPDVAAFWRNLCAGVESITRFTDAELEDAFDSTIRNDPSFVRARAVLDDVDMFDAGFFGMHAREAELTDPQHRVFLECAWHALEDGGYDPARFSGAIGVFAGAAMNTYFLRNVCQDREAVELFTSNFQVGGFPEVLGAVSDFLATRVSYKLDLRGPSVTVQSACSTSLVAVVEACQSLLLYQCDMALAGGVSITLPQRRGYLAQEGAMASPTGRCRTFDAKADGTVFGAGAAVVLLKRLEDALEDGDHIYAVIRGSALNNDGGARAGFAAPSANGQAEVIASALAAAEVDARTISYVECHGTATPLGDPIEVAGLTKAFRASTKDVGFCALGSVKPNVGHLDAAAGATGLIKTALALENGRLPATLFFETPNPYIEFEGGPFYVNAALTDWPRGRQPRRAGVSAFGVGGTNAHVVLEEAPEVVSAPATAPTAQAIVVSARSEAALGAARQALAGHLRAHPELPLADVAYTLQVGRRGFSHRCAVACADIGEAASALETGKGLVSGTPEAAAPLVAFMFPGQGAQYPSMGEGLYHGEAVFRASMRRSAEILKPALGRDLCALLYGEPSERLSAEDLQATEFAQPALFAVGYALAKLWMGWGVSPDMMIGHSVGEFVAACIAGVFSPEDALALIAARGRLMQDMPRGSMLAVRLPEAELAPLLSAPLALAAVNGPKLCVAAGPDEAIARLDADLIARNIPSRRLHTSHAFHTPMMDPAADALREQVAKVRLSAPKLRVISSTTGKWLTGAEATSPAYWAEHCRAPVRFGDGLATLLRDAAATGRRAILLEAGPGAALSTLARQGGAGSEAGSVLASLPEASRPESDDRTIARSLAQLWCSGVAIDWRGVHADAKRRRLSLPAYPFERSRYWIAAPRLAGHQREAPQETRPSPSAPSTETPLEMKAVTIIHQDALPPLEIDRKDDLRQRVIALLENLSGDPLEGVGAETTFLDMGFDSLFLSQVAQQLQRDFKVKLTFRQLLGEFSTIDALVEFLDATLPREPAPPHVAPYAAPAAVAALPAAPSSAAIFTSLPSVATPGPGTAAQGSAVEQIMREQLETMSRLMAAQLEALRGAVQAPAGGLVQQPSRPAPASLASVTPASAAPLGIASPAERAAVPAAPPASPEPKSRFEMLAAARNAPAMQMTPSQQRNLAALIERFNARTAESKRRTAADRPVLADPRVAASFRPEWKDLVYPIITDRAAGSRIWDVDGNEYFDLVNGYGQTAFGHAPPFVVDAVAEQLKKGFAIGPQAELAGKVAALFRELTGNERVTFCNTGSEAVMAAMRIARTVTGRSPIVMFTGDYHGQFDEVLVKGNLRNGNARTMAASAGIPKESVENMVVLPYGAPESLDWIRTHAEEIAAVMVEPVQSRHPELRPVEFLKEIRKITEAAGAALIFDEVVTGFRNHPGGMQHIFGIRADLATYGKVVGGGLPVGVLAGKAAFMDALDGGQWQYGDESYPEVGVTFFAGTFVRHPLVLAAVWAVLNHVKDEGPALQERLTQRTAALVERLNNFLAQRGLDVRIETYGSLFLYNFATVSPYAALFAPHMLERGVYVQDNYPCFLTTAHSDEDLAQIAEAFESSVVAMQEAGFFPKPPGLGAAECPLTEAQSEIWLAAQLSDEASCAFNESVTLRLRGSLDLKALATALNQVVARHDALRGSFEPSGERMRIAPVLAVAVADHDLAGLGPEAAESAWQDLLAADAAQPFDLVNGPLIRAYLVKRGANDHALVLTFHHIVADGWSINTIIGELAKLYEAARTGAAADLPEPMPFARYAEDEKPRLDQDGDVVDAFWLPQFSPPPAPLDLPTDRPRPALKTYEGGTITATIEPQSAQRMRKAAAKLGCTSFAALLATFEILLGRLAGQDEVVVGIPAAGQALVESESLVGHCVNFLPLRGRWRPETTLAEHFAETRRIVLSAFENQNFTLGTLMRKMPGGRAWGGRPLVEASFNLERIGDRIHLPELEIEAHSNPKRFANFDLFFNVTEQDGGLRIDCDYNTDLFDADTIRRWIGHYHTLIDAVADEISERGGARPIALLALLRPEERARAIGDADALPLDPRPAHEIFVARAKETPQAVAAECEDARVSYGELDRRSNQAARRLAELGVAPGDFVGLLAERSIETVVAILGVLKAGAVYVPLDPSYPAELLAFMLQDCSPKLTLGRVGLAKVGDLAGSAMVDLEQFLAAAASASEEPVEIARCGEDLAYIMYTSGSTGRPKGVKIPHRGIVRLVTGQTYARFKADEVFLHAAPLAFDASTFEIWGPLLNGGQIAIIRDPRASLDDIVDAIRRHGVTTAWFTAGLFNLLVEQRLADLQPLRTILTGGDILSPAHIEEAVAALPKTQLVNGYGPTENTTFSCCYPIPTEGWGGGAVPIGFPIAHTEAYILGPGLEPVPPGVIGELCVGGAGLAQGYLNRPELTAEKFVPHPFSSKANERIYLTGDRARRRADGVIEFLGRSDAQVKINGKRVELEEIENVLRADPRISDALVAVRDENASKRIVAYLKPAQSAALPDEPNFQRDVIASLRTKLPDHMIPSTVVTLDAFPLTPNGKVDRRQLPAPAAEARLPVAAPVVDLTDKEKSMAQIWREVLNVPAVGPESNFFELGGHSLLAMRLVGRVATAFGVKIRVVRLFEAPTLREFTALVSKEDAPKETAVVTRQDVGGEKSRQVETRTEYGNIVYIQQDGTKTPIIAIHNTLMYYKLARQIGADRRFVGIKLFDESAPRALPSGTMAEIAADYVRVIRAAQPKGPYVLVGLCVAGIIAYEAALQLRREGEAVPLVVVADTWAPGLEESLPFFKRVYLDKINYLNSLCHRFGLIRSGESTVAEVLSTFSIVRMTRILDLAAWFGWIKPTEQGKDDHDTWLFLRALAAARATSSSEPFDGDLVVFQSEEVVSRFAGPHMGWDGLVTGEIHFSKVPGWHEDIFQGEGPAVMAEFLRPLLQTVDAQSPQVMKRQDA